MMLSKLLAILFILIVLSAGNAFSGVPRVAVLPFDSPREFSGTPLGSGIAEMIATELMHSGGVQVVERSVLDALVRERKLQADGIVEGSAARKAAQLLGVDYLITGKVTEFGVKEDRNLLGAIMSNVLGGAQLRQSTARVVMDVRLIDASNARVLSVAQGRGENNSASVAFAAGDIRNLVLLGNFETREWKESRIGRATRQAVEEVSRQFSSFFPPMGTIEAVFTLNGRRYVILDRGAFAGLEKGQEFLVQRVLSIRDDDGQEIWRETANIGRIQIDALQNDRAKALVLSEDTPMEKGDLYIWEAPGNQKATAQGRIQSASANEKPEEAKISKE